MAERYVEEYTVQLTRALGRPRTVLDVGCGQERDGELARSKGADVLSVDDAEVERFDAQGQLGDRRFDLIRFGSAVDRARDPGAILRRFLPFLAEGGHVMVPRRELADGAGLEVLWSGPTSSREFLLDVARAPWKPARSSSESFVVAPRPPAHRELSLTVGMISMNEENAVGGVIDEIRKHAPKAEILLVDSSKDRTPQIAEERGARVVRQFPPKGYGPAMHRLLYEARTDVIVTMDCDGTYPADRIMELHRLVEEGADLVNATRTRHRPEAMPLPNFVANRVFAEAARLLHGVPTTDVHSGMRAYRTSMLRGIHVEPKGAALPVELLVVPARLGYRIVEVEIPYFERIGNTTLHRFDSTKWTFKRLLNARAGARARPERVKVM